MQREDRYVIPLRQGGIEPVEMDDEPAVPGDGNIRFQSHFLCIKNVRPRLDGFTKEV